MVEQRKEFIINGLYYGILMVGLYFLVVFSARYLMPFIVGFVIASLLKPLVGLLTSRFGQKKYLSLLVIILFYIVLGFALVWLVFALLNLLISLSEMLPIYYKDILEPGIIELGAWFNELLGRLDSNFSEFILGFSDDAFKTLISVLNRLSNSLIAFLSGFVKSVPSLLISILIAIISSFFFTLDYQNIVNALLSIFPKRTQTLIVDVKHGFITTLGKYLRSYIKLMSLTFVELSIAFTLLGIGNPFGLALLIASVDILPVLGTGSIMIPWFIFELAVGDTRLGVMLLLVYIMITVVRNILEPRIVGKQIGLHPLLTLVCIYVGLKLFGFVGLIGLPIMVTILMTLNAEGKLSLFKKKDTSLDKDLVV